MQELSLLISWKIFATISFIFFGIQNYLYKIIVQHELDAKVVTYAYVTISCIITLLVIIGTKNYHAITLFTLFIAALDSLAYYCTTISRIEALKYIPSSLMFPIVRSSTLVIVLFGVCVLSEPLTPNLIFAIGICVILVYLVCLDKHQSKSEHVFYNKGILLSLFAMITSAATNIISRYAAIYSDPLVYMTLANLIISLTMKAQYSITNTKIHICKKTLLVATILAVVNLIAWFSYLYALKKGPLSIVSTISSLAFVIPIFLSLLIDKEKITPIRLGIIILAIVLMLII